MFNSAKPENDSFLKNEPPAPDVSLYGAQLTAEESDNNDWQTVDFPGSLAVDQISGTFPNPQPNAMDSSSTHQVNSTQELSAADNISSKREVELLNLVRDLNECNDVLLTKVSQLEESLERSQTALQAEIDRSGGDRVSDREIVQLVTELEQSNQALQHHQMRSETLQTELTVFRERATQLEIEHKALQRQHAEQAQELLQSNTNCRDLRARLQRQQRYTLQFKAALEKCLSMSTELQPGSVDAFDPSSLAMPKVDEIRPWEATLGVSKLDPQLESMIRGLKGDSQFNSQTVAVEAEDQLWHDLARVMEPTNEAVISSEDGGQTVVTHGEDSSQFIEPTPWSKDESGAVNVDGVEETSVSAQLSPQASEILARVQAGQAGIAADTYLPAMSAQSSPSPLVKPLRPQKRISSLSAIDLPNFPRLKKQPPAAKA